MDEENELIALRRKKLDTLRAKGVEPFGGGFEVTGSITEVREKFKEGETLRIAGRITAHRDRTHSNLYSRERSRRGAERAFPITRSWRFHRGGGNLFCHQKRGTDI